MSLRIGLAAGDGLEPALALLRRVRPEWEGEREGDEGAVVALDERDVGAFDAAGALALGIAPKDRLAEQRPRVVELLDLGLLRRRLVLAAPAAAARTGAARRAMRVVTAHPRLTAAYVAGSGGQAEIVTLTGSLAAAVHTGLADAVVGLTPGGDVPDEFEVQAVVLESSLRLIAGSGARLRHADEISALANDLRALVEDS